MMTTKQPLPPPTTPPPEPPPPPPLPRTPSDQDAERPCLACECGGPGGLPRDDDIAVFPSATEMNAEQIGKLQGRVSELEGHMKIVLAEIQPEPVCFCGKHGVPCPKHGPLSETEFRIADVARWFGVSIELLTSDNVQQGHTAFRERLEARLNEACEVAKQWAENYCNDTLGT